MKSVFDSSFKYTPSFKTDVRKTFDRIRLEQQTQIGSEDEHAQIHRVAAGTKLIVHRPAQPAS
jgi:hypothetical protein